MEKQLQILRLSLCNNPLNLKKCTKQFCMHTSLLLLHLVPNPQKISEKKISEINWGASAQATYPWAQDQSPQTPFCSVDTWNSRNFTPDQVCLLIMPCTPGSQTGTWKLSLLVPGNLATCRNPLQWTLLLPHPRLKPWLSMGCEWK